jgi:hypothetical protein
MGKIITVTPSTIGELKQGIKGGMSIIILYHMIGCPHCEDILANPVSGPKGEWVLTRKKVQGLRNIVVAEVESRYRGLLPLDMQNIDGFPAVVAYTDKHAVEYSGPRTEAGFLGFITRFMRPASAPPRLGLDLPKKPKPAAPKRKAKTKTASA